MYRYKKQTIAAITIISAAAAAAVSCFVYFKRPFMKHDWTTLPGEEAAFNSVMQAVRDGNLQGTGTVYKAKSGDDLAAMGQTLQPGDTLYLSAGTYPAALALSDLHGTAENYITIMAEPGAEAVLDGSGLTKPSDDPALPEGPVMITLDHCSYVCLSGLSIENANGQGACGILVSAGCDHLIIDRCHMENITVPEPAETDHCANGIILFGDSADEIIQHVFIYGNTIENCATGWSECISVTGHVSNVTVENNTIDNTGNIGIDFAGSYGYCPDPAKDFPTNCRAVGNTVKNCRSPYATSYGLYVDGAQGIDFSNNVVRACSGGIEIGAEQPQQSEAYATKRIRVAGNTVTDCAKHGITIGGYETDLGWVEDVEVTGNNCRNNGLEDDGSILTLSKCKDILIENNIFTNDSGSAETVRSEMGSRWTKRITFRGNTY